jgi:hypothetical protein
MSKIGAGLSLAILLAGVGVAGAQSTGGSPNDPNNARNQFPAPSASQPTDPAAEYDPLARVPTAPEGRLDARNQPGGETGYRPGYLPPAPVVGPPEVVEESDVVPVEPLGETDPVLPP